MSIRSSLTPPEELTSLTKYMWVAKLPKAGETGIIYLVKNGDRYEQWAWWMTEYKNGKEKYGWANLGTTTIDAEPEAPEAPKMRPTNCKNCGAPLENGKCKYCGTEYR